MGYQVAPKKVIAVVMPQEDENYTNVMNYLEAIKWDYLAIPELAQSDVNTWAT